MENHPVNKTNQFKVLTVLAIAASLSLGVYMYQGKEISLSMDGEIKNVISYAETVNDLLKKEKIHLKKGAYINVSLDSKLEDKMNIIIKNPKPYTLSLEGSLFDVKSVHDTVGEVLKDLGIALGEKDYTYPKLDGKLTPNSNIEVFRVRQQVEEVEAAIPFKNIVTTNNKLDVGAVNIVQEGKDGLKKSQIKKEYVNGVLTSTTVIKEEIISEPVDKIVEKGSKSFFVSSRGKTNYKKSIIMTATAYDLSYESTGKNPGDKYYGLTASGTKARPGVVAVDPRIIPLGTKLYVQSLDGSKDYGFAIAEDTGGAIKNNKIDLFFNSANEVNRFGRRKVKVYIIED